MPAKETHKPSRRSSANFNRDCSASYGRRKAASPTISPAEVWHAVAAGISRFDGDWSDFRAWVFAIARKRLADHRRTAVRRHTDVVDVVTFEHHAGRRHHEDEALDKMSGQRAAALITSVLRGEQAEVVLLRVLADLDVDQVAPSCSDHRTGSG